METIVEKQTTELAVFDEVAATIAKWKVKNEKLGFDYETPQGEKDARSHIHKLRKVKVKVGEIHKEAKAGALAYGRRLDAKKNEYNGEVDGMIKFHKDPLDKIAAEKQAIVDAEIKKAEEEEVKRQAELEAREKAVQEAEEKLAKEKAEAERIEREKRIAEEAAAKAKVEAEGKAKAESDAKELAEKKRKEAEEKANQRRAANRKHREKIEGQIHFALTENGFEFAEASDILLLLKENKIPHVSINY